MVAFVTAFGRRELPVHLADDWESALGDDPKTAVVHYSVNVSPFHKFDYQQPGSKPYEAILAIPGERGNVGRMKGIVRSLMRYK
jgi:hypothetical protein